MTEPQSTVPVEPLSAAEEATLRRVLAHIFRDAVPIPEDDMMRRLLATLDAARQPADPSPEALERVKRATEHSWGCPLNSMHGLVPTGTACTCGLSEALAALAASPSPQPDPVGQMPVGWFEAQMKSSFEDGRASRPDPVGLRWLRCSSCHEPVPETDATVICIECGEGMVFTANAAASRPPDLDAITQADAAASLVHDYIWQKPVLSGTTPPSQDQASDAIWTIHSVLRPLLAALPVHEDEPTGIDRERLAKAMAAAEGDFVGKGSVWTDKARAVAVEYDRLTREASHVR